MATVLASVANGDRAGSGVQRLFVLLLGFFFLLMLVFPTIYRLERGALLAVLLLGACIHVMMQGRWSVDHAIIGWTMVTVTAGALFMWNGALLGAPGAASMGTVHVLWPMLYLFFIGMLRNPATLIDLHKVMVSGVFISAVLGILLVVATLAGYGRILAAGAFETHDVAAGMYDGFARYRMTNVATVIYGVGFVLALLALPKQQRWCSRLWTMMLWIALLTALAAVMLSGRRAAWLVVLLAPCIVIGLLLLSGQRLRMGFWLVLAGLAAAAAVAILAYFDLQLSAIAREFVNAFDFSAEQSASVRGIQGEVLLAAWAERPFIGHGLGAVTEVVRSFDQPWAYELSYLALLFQTGTIGITIYTAAVLWVFWSGIRVVRKIPHSASVMLPLLAGLAGFLVANSTNPYLAKFDYLWVIFLPVAAVNVYRGQLRRMPVDTVERARS